MNFIIGITGGSGSGKTTLIRKLRKAFSTEELCIISQDDYYRPREAQQQDANGVTNFDLPSSIDDQAFLQDIKRLRAGETVRRMEYVFNNPLAKAKELTFEPAPIIIVEGLFVFHFAEIAESMDMKVYVHAKDNLKVIRRIRRDQVERNYPLDDVLYRYQHHVLPAFEQYIAPYKEDADLVINNNHSFDRAFQVLSGFLRDKLG
jgi:uridine kinase